MWIKHPTFSHINGIMSSLLFRFPASFVLGITLDLGLQGVGLGAPIASGASLIFGVLFFLSGKWKSKVINN